MSQQSFGEFAFQKTVSTGAVVATLGCTPFFSGIFVFTWLNVSQLCQKSLVHNVSSLLEVEREEDGVCRGVVTSQRKMHARLSFSAMFVIMFIFWYSVFKLPSMWGVELIWRSERRNLLIAGLELRSFDFVIWSNWTEIAASMGLHRPQVVVFNYFRFFPINLLRNIMEECQNVRPYRYFADIHVGQRAS